MPSENSPVEPVRTQWHALDAGAVATELGSDLSAGISSAEAATRLVAQGPNTVATRDEEPWWREVLESLAEPLQLLLMAVAGVYFWLGERNDALVILGVILVVVAIEVFSELRAKRAVASLSLLSAPNATLVRQGQPQDVPALDLVPGDLVLLFAGDRVAADLRLIETSGLRVDESSLTGESVPVLKRADAAVDATAELGDQTTMAYAGTLVTGGKGRGLVVATGRSTELGRIAGLVEQARESRTPLQQSLRQLSGWLLWVAVGFSLLVPALGVLVADRPVKEMVLVGLTLAFATIPEELPILITMVLGLGAYQLSKRHAIVRRLKAAETLGSVTVVATDKTGTLTENRMRLVEAYLGEQKMSAHAAASTTIGQRALLVGALANDAQLTVSGDGPNFIGDPTETALLAAARDGGIDLEKLRREVVVVDEFPFTDDHKRMSVLVREGAGFVLAAKGSPESILAVCSTMVAQGQPIELDAVARGKVLEVAESMAARGLRVLALGEKTLASADIGSLSSEEAEGDLLLLGLVGLEDPPRPQAAAAVRALNGAGVRVVMITGDHPATASAIARQVGIDTSRAPVRGAELEQADDAGFARLARKASVFARTSPEQKLRIVRALQTDGEVVAVTGDGVNDAPALREATIGVAMGRSGTDVARESADLIVADDNFATVAEAVRTGRVLYANLRKAVRYYLAAKVALVLASLAAVLMKLPVPFEPVQIIIMELFMDLGASLTFAVEPPEDDLMSLPPRDQKRRFMDGSMQLGIALGGVSLGAAVLVGYLGALHLGADVAQARTAAFGAWMLGHVVLAAHMRAERQPLFSGALLANKAFLVWAAAAVGLVVATGLQPALGTYLHLVAPAAPVWWLVVVAALVIPSWWEPWKWLQRLRSTTRGRQADQKAAP